MVSLLTLEAQLFITYKKYDHREHRGAARYTEKTLALRSLLLKRTIAQREENEE